mmetsp:Transcript_2001/g.4504  ORF Transcript_2001/g.4504 Transcript_2001/m.4504 type:complete len:266 (-) Transcript_2001:371-1168(-)
MTLNEKLNKMFPYQTERMIVIEHWQTSFLYKLFYLLIIIYTIVYVFLVMRKMDKKELNVGYTYYLIEGKAYATNSTEHIIAFDIGDIAFPEREVTGPFFAAKVYRVVGQTLGYCGAKCTSDADCEDAAPLKYPICMDNGRCKYYRWCPDMDYADSDDIEVFNVHEIEKLTVHLFAGIEFPTYSGNEYTSNEDNKRVDYPDSRANYYKVGDFMDEGGVDIDNLRETGAAVKVYFSWNCDVKTSDCSPDIEYDRIDADDTDAPVTAE